jgi:RNA 2',3'-cyclic 3'-phosphodiesterase
MTDPSTTASTSSASTAGSSHRGTRFTMTAYKPSGPAGPARSEVVAMRLFVAITPPAAVLDELDALATPLRTARPDLRWTNREAWHVTLAFLGQVESSAAARLLPRLERAARRHDVFRLAFSGAGAFPAPARATVLWGGLSGDRAALARLAQSVAAGASRAGAPPPDQRRRFRPHLTLARCQMPADVTELVAALSGYQGQPWTADRIHLIRSQPAGRDRAAPVRLAGQLAAMCPGEATRPARAEPGPKPRPRPRPRLRLPSGLAELFQDRHRRPERGPLGFGQLGQPASQPGVLPAPDPLHDRSPLLGDLEDDLAPVGRVR